ncbi:hypothetical protein IL306_002780 [Fusarium sp. DS 682]|nr:hypothetical protein IL306_002780 [Fusarium sp. DS 682]
MDLDGSKISSYEDGYPIKGNQEEYEEDPKGFHGGPDVENGVLFIRSTISQDDTKDMESKERSMLVQLTDRLNSGGAGLGPLRNSIPPYPGMPAHISQQLLRPEGPRNTFNVPLTSFRNPYPFHSPTEESRPLYKVDKKAIWRQRLLDRRRVAADLVANDDLGQQSEEASSEPQNALKFDKINPVQNLEPQPMSGPAKNIREPMPEIPLALHGGENTKSDGQAENHSVRSLEPDKGSSHIEEGAQITASEEQGATSPRKKNLEDGTPRTDSSAQNTNLPNLGLAESLSYIMQRHLGVNILDHSADAVKFSGYLLDTIELLERRLSYLKAPDEESDSSSEDGSGEQEGQVPRWQILHRIFCYEDRHHHIDTIFEDQPTLTNDGMHGTKILLGQVPITNLSGYLTQRPSICFIVFKEHKCPSGGQLKHQGKRLASQRLERLRIVSPILAKALEKVAEFSPWYQSLNPVPSHMMEEMDDVAREMDAPYDFLFHHRRQLAALGTEDTTYSAILTPLREYLEQNYEKEYEAAEALFQKDIVTPLHMGKLFKPNQMVIVQNGNPPSFRAYVLITNPSKEKDKLSFKGWSWEYNGAELRRKSWKGTMALLPDEETVITELPIHPADFAKENALRRVKARGKEFWNLKDRQFSTYSGFDWNREQFYAGTRFMVDMYTYHKMHRTPSYDITYRPYPYDSEEPLKFDDWPVNLNRHEMPSEQAMMLLPPMIYGFNIEQKRWVSLDVEKIKPMKWNKKAFDRLVLDSKTKELIYALVDVQTSKDKNMDDIIAGKGNGLIILLHGSPGTGKTLTAESVAEIAEKPLYRVTCGDIGTEAQEVEKYLQTVLYLGKIWDCVLLMDEADVFLEERSMADLQRNSLVSVFLRILEYYEGILILTSNRVGTFDEAFKSRIQVAIHYDKLTKGSRKQIWQNFFDMIEESNEDVNMSELEHRLDELAAEEMNGRQIRNALLTARQLAKHRKERLDWEHLSQVMRTSAAFNKYLKSVKGHTDEQWAREERIR